MRSVTGTMPKNERGFALLVVMLLAAAVAFSLYTQVPRVAFEGMREREQLLMDRGNQYKRAIQVYYAVNKRFPARIEDLENTNDKRFLRRRYKDPMTGKDEWRLIHTNGSFLTDSLVQKPPAQNAANGAPGTGILPGGGPLGGNIMNAIPGQGSGAGTPAADGGVAQPVALNPAAQRRPSDRMPPGNLFPGGGATPQQDNGAPGFFTPNYDPNNPATWPPITLTPVNPQTGQPGQNGQPGQPVIPGFGGQNAPGQPPNTPFNPFGGQQQQPGQLPNSIPGFGGQNAPGQQPNTQINPPSLGVQPGQPGFPNQPPVTIPGFGSQNAPGQQPNSFPFGPPPNQGNDPQATFQPSQGQPNGFAPQTPSGIPGQSPGAGGVNPQPTNIFNPGLGFGGNPLAPDPSQPPASFTPQNQNGNTAGNAPAQLNSQFGPIAQAINNQLTRPTGPAAPGANPQAGPAIAGVASTFEGASIKIYRERSKYKEWEFVFDPSSGGIPGQQVPGANGQNPAGQPGQVPGGNPLQPQGTAGSMFGPTPSPFAPTTNPSGPTPAPAAPANPFTPAQSPSGQPANPFAPANPFGAQSP